MTILILHSCKSDPRLSAASLTMAAGPLHSGTSQSSLHSTPSPQHFLSSTHGDLVEKIDKASDGLFDKEILNVRVVDINHDSLNSKHPELES